MANYKEQFSYFNGAVPVTGEAANLSFRISPYSGDIGGLAFAESPAASGNYLCSGFTAYYLDAKLFHSGVEVPAFGIKNIGDPEDGFLSLVQTTEQDVVSVVDFNHAGGLKTNVVAEHTGGAGVLVDAALIKDGSIRGAGVVQTDVISEFNTASGVTIDGVLIKDNIYTGHTGRAWLAEANNILVDCQRAADLTGYVYNDLDSAVSLAAGLASVNSRQNIYVQKHIGLFYTLSQAIPDYVNIIGIGGLVIVRGIYSRSGSVALSSRMENIYFEAYDGNHVIVRTIAMDCVWQTLVDAADGGTISTTTSHLTDCGLYGTYTDVGDDITSGGNNKITKCYGNFNVAWQSSDKMYKYNFIADDTFSY